MSVSPHPMGKPISGPTALGDDPKRFFMLTRALAVTDFKLRFFGSVLGYFWTLARPLMLFGVLFVVFSVFLDFGGKEKYFGVSLLLGIVLFSFLNEATSQGVRSLVNRENLVRKVDFPRLAVPLSVVLTALFNLLLNLIPVIVFLIAVGGRPRVEWLELPLLIALLALLALGLSMWLSVLYVRFRDIEPIWDVVLQVTFYASPVFYTLGTVREKAGEEWIAELLMLNPFAAIMQQGKHAVIDPSHDSVTTAIGEPLMLLVPAGLLIFTVVGGFLFFRANAPRVAEEL